MSQIKIRNPTAGDHTVTCSNNLSVQEVKENYLKIIGNDKVGGTEVSRDLEVTGVVEQSSNTKELTDKIRFFCMGKELKDDLFVYSYDLESNMVVQAMFRK